MNEYRICNRCVMDNISDSTIEFDINGHCNYCSEALKKINKVYFPNKRGEKLLDTLIAKLKKESRNKKYDCIMGISGGLDSSYLAYLGAMKWGLRILAVHIDDGYDTQISINNIKKLCDKAKIDLIVLKPDTKQYNELIRAYLVAGVPNVAAPQDNILLAYIYEFAKKNGIRFFLSGGNFALESILEKGNTHDNIDVRNIKDINQKHGRGKLDKLKFLSPLQKDINLLIHRIESPRPLNYIEYNRETAFNELKEFCGFEYYGSKHLENTLTKFIQVYWLYNKYKVDKRKSHLSSMIVSGQMSRNEALEVLKQPLYDENELDKDIDMILQNVGLSKEEFQIIMNEKPRQHRFYKTSNYSLVKRKIRKIF